MATRTSASNIPVAWQIGIFAAQSDGSIMQGKKIVAGPLLKTISSPHDIRGFDKQQLSVLVKELRQYIIDIVAEYGGHFGASLGVVELTVALHYVFNTPYDLLVWDVGHQAYGHKIITGRRDQFLTNRKYNGLSGFPKRSESEYDTFGVGHASTSISAAVGMMTGAHLQNENDRQVIAVIGDGAMTGGLAFEGLNNASNLKDSNLLIVLNDNCMSIDPNVGALRQYLTDITTSTTYNKLKTDIWNMLGKLSHFGKNSREIVSRVENAIKSMLVGRNNLFESFNLRYFGPVDGHDLDHLVDIMEDLKKIPGPKLLHCITKKGKGFKASEEGDPSIWHAPGKFDHETGKIIIATSAENLPPKYQDVFGYTIIELAKENEKIVGVTPAMPTGCSLKFMMEEMPDRAFDVGIAEQHAVTFSAGMATRGLRPFCNIYSTFMQRAYDQVIHDVAIQKLPVIFCLDRGGLVGADGPTHHGVYDLAYLRCVPNMIVSAPMNETELRNLMYTAQLDKIKNPFSIRYPRGRGISVDWKQAFKEIEVGSGRMIKDGEKIAILSIGHPGNFVVEACKSLAQDKLYPAHFDMRFVKPLDENLLNRIFARFKQIITIEDGTLVGGFGSAILEFMADRNYSAEIIRLGIPDRVIEHGTQAELWNECGYDVNAIIKTVKHLAGQHDTIMKS